MRQQHDIKPHFSVRIALLAPLVSPIREPYLGGAQALLRDLAVTLARRGHDVTLYAAIGSDSSILPGVRLQPVHVDTTAHRPADFSGSPQIMADTAMAAAQSAFTRAFETISAHASQHDLLHGHAYDVPAFSQDHSQPLPVAHTLHMPNLDPTIRATLHTLAPTGSIRDHAKQPWLTTVSQACADTYADTCRIDMVIHNGIDFEAIPFGARASEPTYLLFAGRIAPEKGPEDAIAIARAAGMPLLLAGGIYDERYFAERIQPLLATAEASVRYLGPLSHEEVWSLMAGATAVLAPSQWEEPFGLAACEAQAAGAPVIGYARGGLLDIIAHGETGLLTPPGDIEAAAMATTAALDLDRRACRARVSHMFSLDRMAAGYESLYQDMLT